MSSDLSPLLSATFYEPGDEHLVELVHQRDAAAVRRLASLEVAVYDADGREVSRFTQDPDQEILELGACLRDVRASGRLMVLFDARYDERVFPYRPHHYAYVHRRASPTPPLYYAVNAVLGGVPDRIGAAGLNNFETYVFRTRPFDERYGVMLGNVGRFAAAEADVTLHYERDRVTRRVMLPPKAHVELDLPASLDGQRLGRVEVQAVFRLATYVVGRRAPAGDLVLFDHLFTYFT